MDVQQLPERATRVLEVLVAHREDEGPLSRQVIEAESGLHPRTVGRALKDLEARFVRVICTDENKRFVGYRYEVSNQLGSVSPGGVQPGVQPAWLHGQVGVSNQDEQAVSNLARATYVSNSLLERDTTTTHEKYDDGLPTPAIVSTSTHASIAKNEPPWVDRGRELAMSDYLAVYSKHHGCYPEADFASWSEEAFLHATASCAIPWN